jgi:hypothetical protein
MVGLAQINSIRSATGDPLTRHIAGVRCVAETLKALERVGALKKKSQVFDISTGNPQVH